MTIQFFEENIKYSERQRRKPYIGYISPYGELIDYNIELSDEGHDNWKNPVSNTFLDFIVYIQNNNEINFGYNGFRKSSCSIELILKQINEKIQDIERIFDFEKEIKRQISDSEWYHFEYDLLLFFKNAYLSENFFESINKTIIIDDIDKIICDLKKRYNYSNYPTQVYVDAKYCIKKQLLTYLKDICVQYLGYDSIERFTPNGNNIVIPRTYEFNISPRIITTSDRNIYRKYYNYLLMGWRIDKVPKYIYNTYTKKYEEEVNHSYCCKDEERLKNEIDEIINKVPIKMRKKYFK